MSIHITKASYFHLLTDLCIVCVFSSMQSDVTADWPPGGGGGHV